MSLSLEIARYLDELHGSTDVCERPKADGEKCIQCCERERVIDRLERIMRAEEPKAPISLYLGAGRAEQPEGK